MKSRYSEAELKTAFEAVETPGDWRAPIDAILTDAELIEAGGWWCVFEAVGHYTATEPKLASRPAPPDDTSTRFLHHITAVGYRNGPAGP